MLFAGDIMLDRNVGKVIAARGFSFLLDALAGEEGRFFRGMDFVGANLEGAVTNGGAHYPPEAGNDFAFSPSAVAQLKSYGFSYFTVANNHSLDQGRRGLDETSKNLSQLGFLYSGCPDAGVGECSATTTSLGGISVGLAGFSMVYSHFDIDAAAAVVSSLASSTELVVVNIHWGTEYEHQFRPQQQPAAA
jgi:poly-gamma-glutamate synthesis protein (capsule biosynthesis protein)